MKDEKLYESWELARKNLTKDYAGLKEGQMLETETWVCRPPNVLMFQINRIDYDRKLQKMTKDMRKFSFDKEIYLDLFLNQNLQRTENFRKDLGKMKEDLQILKNTYNEYSHNKEMGNLIDMFKTCENVLKGDDGNENLIDLGKSNAKGQFVNIQG